MHVRSIKSICGWESDIELVPPGVNGVRIREIGKGFALYDWGTFGVWMAHTSEVGSMATIFTRFLPPTSHRGGRVRVWTPGTAGRVYDAPGWLVEPGAIHDHVVDLYVHDERFDLVADREAMRLVRGESPDGRGFVYLDTERNASMAVTRD